MCLLSKGADYKYIGHGECDANYCAVTATMCTEDGMDKDTKMDICTLPLIHLFVDEDMQCIPCEQEQVSLSEDTKCEAVDDLDSIVQLNGHKERKEDEEQGKNQCDEDEKTDVLNANANKNKEEDPQQDIVTYTDLTTDVTYTNNGAPSKHHISKEHQLNDDSKSGEDRKSECDEDINLKSDMVKTSTDENGSDESKQNEMEAISLWKWGDDIKSDLVKIKTNANESNESIKQEEVVPSDENQNEEMEAESLWKWEDIDNSTGVQLKTAINTQTPYLSLLLDEESLEYLVSTPWNIKDSLLSHNDSEPKKQSKQTKKSKTFNPFTDDPDANKLFAETLAECDAIKSKNPYLDDPILVEAQSQFSPSKNEAYLQKYSVKRNYKSVMQYILDRSNEKCFGLECMANDRAAFCIETQIMQQYQSKTSNKYNDLLNECIDAKILIQIDDVQSVNDYDLLMRLTHDTTRSLHEKMSDINDGGIYLWDRAFFCSL